jgi:RNA polymerase sigma factor (sigma-70 family)
MPADVSTSASFTDCNFHRRNGRPAGIQSVSSGHEGKGNQVVSRTQRFETAVLPYLDAAFNLARWLLRDDHVAQDAVQEAYLRAFRFFDHLRGEDARPWLLGIVRNTCYTLLQKRRQTGEHIEFDEERDTDLVDATVRREDNPERLLLSKLESARLDQAIEQLPPRFREVIVLRELEELSYEQMAQTLEVPVGTVMSRLARARALLREMLERSE